MYVRCKILVLEVLLYVRCKIHVLVLGVILYVRCKILFVRSCFEAGLLDEQSSYLQNSQLT